MRKILKHLKVFFQRRKALSDIYDDLQNLDEVFLEKKLEIFNELVTPKLAEIGLRHWDGKYIWFSDFNDEGVKHVVEFNVFRYFGGSFSFGNCYNFVPTISGGKKLTYHRTAKSTKLIYYKISEGWKKSYEENLPINIDKISTVNEDKLRKSLDDYLERNIPKLEEWFKKNQTIEQNISSLLDDRKNEKKGFTQRIISFDYILCFLYAQKGDFINSSQCLEKHFERKLNNEIEEFLIREKIKNFC